MIKGSNSSIVDSMRATNMEIDFFSCSYSSFSSDFFEPRRLRSNTFSCHSRCPNRIIWNLLRAQVGIFSILSFEFRSAAWKEIFLILYFVVVAIVVVYNGNNNNDLVFENFYLHLSVYLFTLCTRSSLTFLLSQRSNCGLMVHFSNRLLSCLFLLCHSFFTFGRFYRQY